MNTKTIQITACTLVTGLFVSSCGNDTTKSNAGAIGTLSGVGVGIISSGSPAGIGKSVAMALGTAVFVSATVHIIAKHEASENQRRVAEQRARESAAKLEAKSARDVAAGKPKKTKPRYIAVDTVKDEKSVGAKTVMIFDTKSQEIVGNNVYDVKDAPSKGYVAKFDTYAAEYVGPGA